MDVAVEIHAVNGSVTLLRHVAAEATLLAQLQQATALVARHNIA